LRFGTFLFILNTADISHEREILMQRSDVFHIPKSHMAYAVSTTTMEIRLRTRRQFTSIELIFGDPFARTKDEKGNVMWEGAHQTHPMKKEAETDGETHYFIRIDVPTKRVKYGFLIDGRYLYGPRKTVDVRKHPEERSNRDNLFAFPYLLEADIYQAPDWVRDTIWYSIFPDRFRREDERLKSEEGKAYENREFFGGTLKGITEKLDYIQDIGANAIYLNPVFPSSTAHRYDITDYFGIDERLGSEEDFRALVETAHEKGMRVMLDAVFNHVSYKHPFFQDVLSRGKESPYYDCFYFKEGFDPGKTQRDLENRKRFKPPYESFAFSPYMPKVNTDHPIMREHFLKVARYWIEHYDIDGWRLDVANEVSHDFWRAFRNTVKGAKPECFIVGETWDNAYPWLTGDQHDSAMAYDYMFPLHDYFKSQASGRGETLKNAINEVLINYPRHVIVNLYTFLDNHDTPRIRHIIPGIERLKLAYVLLFALPGTPSIYYGGEIGMEGGRDPDNRRVMMWKEDNQNRSLKAFFKTFSTLYRQEAGFKSPDFKWVRAEDDILVFKKEDLLFFMNTAEHSIDCPTDERGEFYDLEQGTEIRLDDALTLPGTSYRILKAL